MERVFERLLFASRWLLAPLYLGLALLLVAFAVLFARELFHIAEISFSMTEEDLILISLSLIDLTLVASLILMVMLAGYENFVSKLDLGGVEQSLAWLGKLDSGSLKLKVAVAIVAISSIHLLKSFMNYDDVPNDKLILLILTHLTFVVSALLLTIMDRMSAPHK